MTETVIKPDMYEIHTGHIQKPQFSTVRGQLDTMHRPQTAQLQTLENVARKPQRAILITPPPPPVTHYSLHYSRVEHYRNDLNRELYGEE